MQPYPNPSYYVQYPQYGQVPNPYIDRLAQLQQYHQTLQPVQNQFQPLGKIVENIEIVKGTDIPMDGNAYYFPKADGSEIYSKQWLSNGTTQIMAFRPVVEEGLPEKIEDGKMNMFAQVLDGIQSDIKTLAEKIDRMGKPARAKKETAEDE